MRKSLSFVISAACALVALQAVAANQSSTASQKPAPQLPSQEDVSTSGRNWTAQDGEDLLPPVMLNRQGVVSWGAATQAGPRNEHVTAPHGSPVGVGDRTNVPGRQ